MSKSIAYPELNNRTMKGTLKDAKVNPSIVVLIGNYILNQMGKETAADEAKLHTKTLFHSVIMSYKIKERLENDRSIHNSNPRSSV